MQDKNDKIKILVHSSLFQFEAEPPEDMWNRILMESRRRRKLIIFRYTVIAASVLILISLGIAMLMPGNELPDKKKIIIAKDNNSVNKSNTQEKSGITGNPEKESLPGKSIGSDAGLLSKNGFEKKNKSVLLIDKISANQDSVEESSEAHRDENIAGGEFSLEKQISDPLTIAAENGETVSVLAEENRVPDVNIALVDPLQPPDRNVPSGKKWELALGYGLTPTIELSNEDVALNSSTNSFSHDKFSAELANQTSYFDEIESTSHNAPVTLGLIISKRLGRRWNIETGVVYTKLGYHIKTIELNSTYSRYLNEQYYIGIPLGIRFSLLQKKRFGIYITQSIIFEKGIEDRATVETYKKGIMSGSEQNNASIKGIQFSSLTGPGGEIKVAGNLSVYGQAGVQLFFLNASQPYSIRSTRMIWPSFQAGLRMHLK